jgi:hypothetical protein
MKRLISTLAFCSITTITDAQDKLDQEVDILGDWAEASQFPRLTISNLFNTGLSEQQESGIERFLSLPDWANDKDIIEHGQQLHDSLQENKKFLLIKSLIQQKIDRLLANQNKDCSIQKKQ